MINVFGMGSCRTYTPLDILNSKGLISVKHSGMSWFTHSTRDAIQKLLIIKNGLVLPDKMLDFVINDFRKYDKNIFSVFDISNIDIFILEISSIKSNRIRNIELQQWCVRDNMERIEQSYPSELVSEELNFETIVNELKVFYEMINFKPLILIPHINLLIKGKYSKPRQLIQEALNFFALQHENIDIFNPSGLVDFFGNEFSLKGDASHYTHDFEKVIAYKLFEKINSLHEK